MHSPSCLCVIPKFLPTDALYLNTCTFQLIELHLHLKILGPTRFYHALMVICSYCWFLKMSTSRSHVEPSNSHHYSMRRIHRNVVNPPKRGFRPSINSFLLFSFSYAEILLTTSQITSPFRFFPKFLLIHPRVSYLIGQP